MVTTRRKWDAVYCLLYVSWRRWCYDHDALFCLNSFCYCSKTRTVSLYSFRWDFIPMKFRDTTEFGLPLSTVFTNIQSPVFTICFPMQWDNQHLASNRFGAARSQFGSRFLDYVRKLIISLLMFNVTTLWVAQQFWLYIIECWDDLWIMSWYKWESMKLLPNLTWKDKEKMTVNVVYGTRSLCRDMNPALLL